MGGPSEPSEPSGPSGPSEPSGQVDAPEAVGRRVRRRRRTAGLSQAELAERAGVSRQAVGALESGRHLPRVDAALAIAAVLGTTVEDLLAVGPPKALHVLDGHLVDGQAVRAARVGDHTVCVPLAAATDGEGWATPDAVVQDGRVMGLDGADLDGLVVVGCDPALGIIADLIPSRGAARTLPVFASSAAALLALRVGRAHAAVVHDVTLPQPLDGSRVHRVRLASWRTGLAAPPDARSAIAAALEGAGEVVQREAGAAAQIAYERALEQRGVAPPPGLRAVGHRDAVTLAGRTATAAVTIEPVASAHGFAFHALETHVVEVWIDAGAVDHPGARALVEVVGSARFRQRLDVLPGYDVAG